MLTIDVPGLLLLNTPDQSTVEKNMPSIDLAETIALVGSEAQAKKMFDLLVKELKENYLPQLEKTVKQQDYIELRKHIHSFIGALCYAKAPRLHYAIVELQKAARNASPSVTIAYQHVQVEAENFLAQYQQLALQKTD